MVPSPVPTGLYLGVDEADDPLDLGSFLNLSQSSQPPSASQPNDVPGPSIAFHSILTSTPGPATFVDGVPVQGS